MATSEHLVLLREDKDSGDLAFFYGNRSSGIVLLRAHGAGTDAKSGAVAEELEAYEGQLIGDPP